MENFEKQFEKPKSPALPTEKIEEQIGIEEIALLYEPAKKILADMRENIEAGQYVAILGDDASGRLPTRLFHRVLGDIYKEKGFERPKTLFFAGREFYEDEEGEKIKAKIQHDFINFLEKEGVIKMAEDRKVLFVTDSVASGRHLQPFTNALRKIGINFDITTIGFTNPNLERLRNREKLLGGKIFWGQPNIPSIYGRQIYSGVSKDSDPSLFARPEEPFPTKGFFEKRRARKDVEILAERLIKWYHEEHKETA